MVNVYCVGAGPSQNNKHYTNTAVFELAIIMENICHWQAAAEEEEDRQREASFDQIYYSQIHNS